MNSLYYYLSQIGRVWKKARIPLYSFFLITLVSCDRKSELQQSAPEKQQTPNTTLGSELSGNNSTLLVSFGKPPESFNGINDRAEIVKEIGKRKLVEAIPILLKEMLNVGPFFINNAADLSDSYPCSVALVQIGEPAVPQIQERFLFTSSPAEHLVLLHTLLQIKGTQFTSIWLEKLKQENSRAAEFQHLSDLQRWVDSHSE